jgi:pimeloyl-ACP methyl ester carboxylesterase
MTITKNFINYENRDIRYICSGNGEDQVLCIQGWGLPVEIWEKFFLAMESLKNNFKFYCIDIGSINMDKNCTLDHLGRSVNDLIDRLQIDPKVIMGHSMGVTIMFYLLEQNFVSPDALVVIDSGVRSSSRTPDLIELVKKKNFKGEYFKDIIKSFFRSIDNADVQRLFEKGSLFNSDDLICQLRAISSFNFTEFVKKITIPSMICYGKYDMNRKMDEVSEISKLIQKSEFVLFDHSGHCPMYEEPDKFSLEFKNFNNE